MKHLFIFNKTQKIKKISQYKSRNSSIVTEDDGGNTNTQVSYFYYVIHQHSRNTV